MNIQDLGALGEFISSFAVLATLIYVAVQLRETRSALMAQAYQARSDTQQDVLVRIAENEELASLLARTHPFRGDFDLEAIDALSETDLRRFISLHQALALRHDNTAHQFYAGYIGESDMTFLMNGLDHLLPLWTHLNIKINPALQRYIDQHYRTTR